jgi:hypothetical protein
LNFLGGCGVIIRLVKDLKEKHPRIHPKIDTAAGDKHYDSDEAQKSLSDQGLWIDVSGGRSVRPCDEKRADFSGDRPEDL